MPPKFKSRITVACNSCRLRKQKCSGNRPICMQCLQHRRTCDWPEQLKRGPSKGYIDALEHRLNETENLLLSLLSQLSDSQLSTSIPPHTSHPEPRPGKRGNEYWTQFPLNSLPEIRSWQDDCLRSEIGLEAAPSTVNITQQPPNPIYPHTPVTQVLDQRRLDFWDPGTNPRPDPKKDPNQAIPETQPRLSSWSGAPSAHFQLQFLW